MPTIATLAFTQLKLEPAIAPERAVMTNVPMVSGVYTRGQVLGQVTTSQKFTTYNDAANDGTQVGRVLMMYSCTVDSDGLVTIGGGNEWAQTYETAPVYIGGYFQTADIPNLDAAAVSDLGKIIYGDTTSGILRVS